jgi:hypothetical protein
LTYEDPNFYANYLDRHLEPSTSAPEPVKTDKPRRADYASYAEYAAAVYERYGAHGSMGAVDVEGDWRRQLAIGNALLSGEWEAVPFQIEAADEQLDQTLEGLDSVGLAQLRSNSGADRDERCAGWLHGGAELLLLVVRLLAVHPLHGSSAGQARASRMADIPGQSPMALDHRENDPDLGSDHLQCGPPAELGDGTIQKIYQLTAIVSSSIPAEKFAEDCKLL